MPLFDIVCGCGHREERLLGMNKEVPDCPVCNTKMEKEFSSCPPMIKIKGEGGYPSRRKQIFNTTSRNHPTLEKEKKPIYFS